MGQSETIETWKPCEITFEPTESYANPYGDVALSATFEHKSGERYEIPGFWNGDDEWKIRFAPPREGKWDWQSTSDPEDPGFEQNGTFDAITGERDSAIYSKGFLQVDDSGRRFVHDDGSSFFWLADTAWAAGAKATPEEWTRYIEHRAEQGFNVVQLNSLPQFDGSEPQNRLPFGEQWDSDTPDPRYFETLDTLVEIAVDHDIFPAFIVLWFNYVPEGNKNRGSYTEYRHPFSAKQAERYARYLAARYGAYGAIWLLSGDTSYEGTNEIEIYRKMAKVFGESVTHPMRSFHPTTNQITPASANEEGWIDFHTFQSGHHWEERTEYEPAEEHRKLEPARPSLNSEPRYEDMAGPDNTVRFDRAAVRRAAWCSVLAGGDAGITYGALGIWPWHREREHFWAAYGWGEPKPWYEALELPGADDYATMKTFLSQFPHEPLVPKQDVLVGHDDSVRAATTANGKLLVYAPVSQQLRLNTEAIDGGLYDCQWVEPTTLQREYAAVDASATPVIIGAPTWNKDGVFVGNIH